MIKIVARLFWVFDNIDLKIKDANKEKKQIAI